MAPRAVSNWQGGVCVITGAGSGIGGGLARHAAAAGMHVVGVDVDEPGLARLEKAIRDHGQSIETRRVDLRDEAAVEALADHVFAKHGKVNLLFNNAGVLVDGKSWERPMRDWRWSFEVNVYGVIHGIRSFVPRMLKQGEPGRVVNTSSQGGLFGGGTFMGPYQASKHAVTVLSETLYAELALEEAPVTASCVCPAEVATGIWESTACAPQRSATVSTVKVSGSFTRPWRAPWPRACRRRRSRRRSSPRSRQTSSGSCRMMSSSGRCWNCAPGASWKGDRRLPPRISCNCSRASRRGEQDVVAAIRA